MQFLNYTEAHHDFRKRLRNFLEREVTPYADQWEQEHRVPKEAWRKMGRAGFLCTDIPSEYGGIGGDFLYSVIVAEEMAKTRQSGLISYLHSDIVVPYISSYGSEEVKKRYLPGCVTGDIVTAVAMTEPDAGSDLAAMTTTAEIDGDEVVINGSKTFISNGINADLVVLAARDPSIENAHQAISLYLVEADTPGFKKGRQLDKMGFKSQDTAELFFSNCRIPKGNLLGRQGEGFLMLMAKLQQERLVCALGGVAAAEQILNETIDYCRKTIDISGRPRSKQQAVQFALVEMATETKIGRTFTEKLIADHMEGANVVIETSMAKYWMTDLAKRIADRSIELFGDFGLLESCPIIRGWRDVRILSIFAGTNEINKQIVGKFMGL